MVKYKGRWTARIEQDFEVEADDEEDARAQVESEMEPSNVIELLDMEIESLEEVE